MGARINRVAVCTTLALVIAGCGSDANGPAAIDTSTSTGSTTTTALITISTVVQRQNEIDEKPTVTEERGTDSTSSRETDSDLIEVVVEDGEVVGGPQTIEVELGSVVRFVVIADTSDSVHVHGYDLYFDLSPGSETEVTFTADVPGIFEVEMEGTHLPLAELEVS